VTFALLMESSSSHHLAPTGPESAAELWLADIDTPSFHSELFRRAAMARPRAARSVIPFLTWEVIGRLVEQTDADMLVVRNGSLRDGRPAAAAEAEALFRDGHSLVLRRCERHDELLRRLADAFARHLEGEVSIQIYATPAGFRSFGWHYDCEDVFIAQTDGVKEYYLRENTVNPRPVLDAMPRDMHFERETTPTQAATLVPGDWLYIPRGWWHVARAAESALSISVGVLGTDARTHS
jgi:50S ribosomal protein L16 3-hydroxylase